MKTLTIENLFSDLEKLKKMDIIYEANKSYINSYNEFINYFKNRDGFYKSDLIIGSHFVYGWMPTVLYLNLNKDDEGKITSLLFMVKNGDYMLNEEEFEEIKRCINNSMVGTSKLLHFINPEKYAIWDSKVFYYFYPNRKSTAGIEKPKLYIEYLKALNDITLHNDFEILYSQIVEFMGLNYEISKFRAVESLIFEIEKNKKHIQTHET